MVDVVGVVDASTVQVTGTVAVTSPSFTDSTDTGSGGGADHTVAAFADDFDPTGSFTTVPLLPGGDTPRAYLTGATILIVEGDHLGLWTIPASGAATAGVLAPGDVIASQTGRVAVAQTADGSTVSGVLIQADKPYVDAIETELAADIDTLNNDVDALAGTDVELAGVDAAAAIRERMEAQAARAEAPTKWAVCGTDSGTFWSAPFQIPSPTNTLTIEVWAKIVGPAREAGYVEFVAESLDGTGDVDRFEAAGKLGSPVVSDVVDSSHLFAEGTAVGATTEWQRPPNAQQDDGALAPMAVGCWVRMLWVYDFDANTITTSYEDDVFWDHEYHGHRFATIGTYENPGITSLHATESYDTWIGRSIATYHQAHVHIWADGTEVLQFDPTSAADGATTIDDAVAESSPGVPVEWTANGDAEVQDAPATGDLTLGETSTTAYRGDRGKTAYDHSQVTTGNPHGTTAADVGAATSSHNHDGTYQPLDSDLTSIAALTTTTFGRSLLTLANAAALLTTSGNGRRKFQNPAYLWDTASSGSEAFITDTGTSQGGGWTTGEGLNDYIEFTDWLDAGTWTLEVWRTTTSASGIATFTLDGSTLGATEDGYSGSTVRNVRITRTGVVVASSGTHTLRIAMLSKHASSSGYRSGIQAYAWRRTA